VLQKAYKTQTVKNQLKARFAICRCGLELFHGWRIAM